MQDHSIWQRYIDGQLTNEERKLLIAQLQQTDDGLLATQLLPGWPDEAPAPMPPAMAMQLDNSLQYILPQKKRNHRQLLWWAAAAILIGVLILNIYPPAKQPVIVPTAARELVNNSSYVRKITLPDHSQLWITPGTHLVIDPAFDEKTRTVSITGEGYFEVSPGSHPFIVNTGNITTTVLGTHFNVEAWPKEKNISISLSSGKVAIHSTDSTLQLKPGTRLIFRKASGTFATRKFAIENESNWKRGALVMDDLPLETAFGRLETRYGKVFRYEPGTFSTARFTGIYEATPLEVILRNMAFIHGFRYKTIKDTIYIQQYH